MKRFWDKVKILGETDCWEWQAGAYKDGCGQFRFQGKNVRASRVAWILTNGPIEDGLFTLHRCDNPPCCNPTHLFLGTNVENLQDMFNKHREPFLIHDDATKQKIAASMLGKQHALKDTSIKSILRQLYLNSSASFTLEELLRQCQCTKKRVLIEISCLKNELYAGLQGPLHIRKDSISQKYILNNNQV